MTKSCMFPCITIDINGPQGNAYCIMGIICELLQKSNYSKEEINEVLKDMTSSDYEHLVNVAKKYVIIKGEI